MGNPLEKHRDQEAEKSVNRNMLELHEADARVRHFKLGFDSAVAFLQAKGIEEFDEFAADQSMTDDIINKHFYNPFSMYIEGARWQHSQNAAKIAALKEKIKELEEYKWKHEEICK